MKILVAFLLVVVSMASSEPPNYRPAFSPQQAQNAEPAPYNPSGWRPSGRSFNLPQQSDNQQSYLPSNPQQSYGPPSQEKPAYEPEEGEKRNSTTESSTEQITTENSQAGNIEEDSKSDKLKEASEKTEQIPQLEKYFLFIPQPKQRSQNLILQASAVAEEAVAPVIPVSPVYQFPQKTAALISIDASPLRFQRIVPVTSFYKNGIYTPFSSSFVQFYQ
ncbi:hypothetical protein WA026_020820 [Henosepilachna vigintioctopunctata]|uniref:DUF4794 domain-containing protein n=1 Tax=Henosepilachna vigintioctopunctata TaxID=420089 RepID=A0AAW1TYA4_9CUCU